MRRPRRILFVSIGLLAILIQVLAPGWAAVAMARQAQSLSDAVICSADHAPSGDTGKPAHQHHAVCPICHVASVTHFVLLADSAGIPLPATERVFRHPHAETAAPRGPPALSSRARAPPTLS